MQHSGILTFKCSGGRNCAAWAPDKGFCYWIDARRAACNNPRVQLALIDEVRDALVAEVYPPQDYPPETDEERDERLKKGK